MDRQKLIAEAGNILLARQKLVAEARNVWLARYDADGSEGRRKLTCYLLDFIIASFPDSALEDWIDLMKNGPLEGDDGGK